MNAYRLFKWLRLFFFWILFLVACSAMIIMQTVQRIRDEMRFHRLYGNDWVQVYEKYEEPIGQTNLKIGMGIFFVVVMCGVLWWLYRHFAAKNSHGRRRHY